MVFGEHDPSHEQLLAMPAEMAEAARHQMVSQVVGPYLIIGSVLVVLALVLSLLSSRPAKGNNLSSRCRESMGPTLKRLFAPPRFRLGVLSQFLYVGAQVGVWSFTIRFVQLVQHGTSEHSATYWLLASLVIYAIGKGIATADESSESRGAAGSVCIGGDGAAAGCGLQPLDVSGLCADTGELLHGSVLANQLWSGD